MDSKIIAVQRLYLHVELIKFISDAKIISTEKCVTKKISSNNTVISHHIHRNPTTQSTHTEKIVNIWFGQTGLSSSSTTLAIIIS